MTMAWNEAGAKYSLEKGSASVDYRLRVWNQRWTTFQLGPSNNMSSGWGFVWSWSCGSTFVRALGQEQ